MLCLCITRVGQSYNICIYIHNFSHHYFTAVKTFKIEVLNLYAIIGAIVHNRYTVLKFGNESSFDIYLVNVPFLIRYEKYRSTFRRLIVNTRNF